MLNEKTVEEYKRVLQQELIPAMGCTEPIAIAYAAARARELLGEFPCRAEVEASGNIIKNVKSVTVPNTNGLVGIEAACIAGIVAGDASRDLQVIASVSDEQKRIIEQTHHDKDFCAVKLADTTKALFIRVRLFGKEHSASVTVVDSHLNIVQEEKDGEKIKDIPITEETEEESFAFMSVEGIYEYANTVDLGEIKDILARQLDYNCKIAQEGLKNKWGAGIGRTILAHGQGDIVSKARAWAAAGSDARMSGCELPVVINSGSGNQGIAVSMPIYVYATEWRISEEKMYRALALADLLGIYQKKRIGRLSAYCGAVSAGCAAGAGVCYMAGGNLADISNTLTNALAISSGIVCDGAKASCAGKIAIAVENGLLAFKMQLEKQVFRPGDGIVGDDIEGTICNVGRLGKDGMKETDQEILHIMLGQ